MQLTCIRNHPQQRIDATSNQPQVIRANLIPISHRVVVTIVISLAHAFNRSHSTHQRLKQRAHGRFRHRRAVPLRFLNQQPQLHERKAGSLRLLPKKWVHALGNLYPRRYMVVHVAVVKHVKAQANLDHAILVDDVSLVNLCIRSRSTAAGVFPSDTRRVKLREYSWSDETRMSKVISMHL